jgi:hypothetical protein
MPESWPSALIMILVHLSEVLPATSHPPATQDPAGADPGDRKWDMTGIALFCLSASQEEAVTRSKVSRSTCYTRDHCGDVKSARHASHRWLVQVRELHFCVDSAQWSVF